MQEVQFAALQRCAVFAPIPEPGLRHLVASGRIEHRPAGTRVLEQGALGPRVMVVLEGRVEVRRTAADGTDLVIARMGQGDVLGELGFLLGMPRTATVLALEPLTVFAMDRAAFQQLVDRGDTAATRFGLELARVLARRMVGLNDRVLELLARCPPDLVQAYARERQATFPLWDD